MWPLGPIKCQVMVKRVLIILAFIESICINLSLLRKMQKKKIIFKHKLNGALCVIKNVFILLIMLEFIEKLSKSDQNWHWKREITFLIRE